MEVSPVVRKVRVRSESEAKRKAGLESKRLQRPFNSDHLPPPETSFSSPSPVDPILSTMENRSLIPLLNILISLWPTNDGTEKLN